MIAFIEIIEHSIEITAFIFVIMLLIEYINMMTGGSWQEKLAANKITQYFVAVLLGAIPGCLGTFAVVAMYGHRLISFGALVAATIITTGDEAFLMLTIIPADFFIITGALIIIGIPSGIFIDFIHKKIIKNNIPYCELLKTEFPEKPGIFSINQIKDLWKNCSLARGSLTIIFAILIFFFATHNEWDWEKITIILTASIALFIVATVPEKFLDEHLWKHIAIKHIRGIFLWIFGAILIIYLIAKYSGIDTIIKESSCMMGITGLVSLIPESGPHMIFVTMYANKIVPISILFTSSLIQDGHGTLPLLASSRRDFIIVKLINFVIGMILGYILLSLGY